MTRIAGVLAAICDATAILLLFFLVISRVFYASFHLTRQFEGRLIHVALENTRGRRIEAAQKLGIGRNTITRKIQELGLE